MGVELRDPEAFANVSPHVVAFEVVSIAPGTNGNPPRGQIRIDAVLRGNLACGTRDASFPPHHSEFSESGKDRDVWQAEPRPGPPVGARLVAAVEVSYDRIVEANARACWPDDEARRARVYRGPTISIITVSMDGEEAERHENPHDAFEAIELTERRHRSAGWVSFPLRSGRMLCTFLMHATSTDLSVLGCEELTDRAGWKVDTALIADEDIQQVLPRLEKLVETDDAVTAYQLSVHGRANLDHVAAALTSGTWPTSGDPAEETAAFARHLLTLMRIATKTMMGVCWEYRGDVTVAPKAVSPPPAEIVAPPAPVLPPPTERMRELETLLAKIKIAANNMTFDDLWEAHGREFASPEYIAEMEAGVAQAARDHATAKPALAALVAMTRAEAPEEIVAWVNAHQAYLTAFIADCAAKGETDTTATMVATDEHAAWEEVRAGTRLFPDQNSFYVTLHAERYRRLFGIDAQTLERC